MIEGDVMTKKEKDMLFIKNLKEEIIDIAKIIFSYAGVADSENFCVINTGNGNIKITIEYEEKEL